MAARPASGRDHVLSTRVDSDTLKHVEEYADRHGLKNNSSAIHDLVTRGLREEARETYEQSKRDLGREGLRSIAVSRVHQAHKAVHELMLEHPPSARRLVLDILDQDAQLAKRINTSTDEWWNARLARLGVEE